MYVVMDENGTLFVLTNSLTWEQMPLARDRRLRHSAYVGRCVPKIPAWAVDSYFCSPAALAETLLLEEQSCI